MSAGMVCITNQDLRQSNSDGKVVEEYVVLISSW